MYLLTDSGQVHPLKPGVNTVGRTPGNDIVLADGAMSRRHAELHWDGVRCIVVDLGSTNGTYLYGQRLRPNQPELVPPGARLGFGPNTVVTLADDAVAARPAAYPPLGQTAAAQAEADRASAGGLALMVQALDVALERRKLGLAFVGILATAAVLALFWWMSVKVTSESSALGIAIGLLGLVTSWVIATLFRAALARLSLLELSGEGRGDAREALAYAGRHFLSFFFSPLLIAGGLLLIMAGEAALLLVGRIDYLGEVLASLAFLPLVLLNLTLLVVALFASALTDPIIADRGTGVGETISAVLAVVRRKPVHLVAYMLGTGVAWLLFWLTCLALTTSAVYTTLALTSVGLGLAKFQALLTGLPFGLQELIPGSSFGFWGRLFGPQPAVTFGIARFLLGLSTAVLLGLLVAAGQTLSVTVTSAVYLVLRRFAPHLGFGAT